MSSSRDLWGRLIQALLAVGLVWPSPLWAQEVVPLLNPAPPAAAAGGRFGFSMAAVGDAVLVGAPGCSPLVVDIFALQCGPMGSSPPVGPGAAHLFDQGGALVQSFRTPDPPGPTPGDSFGYSLAAVGAHVLVGAPYADVNGIRHAGAAYLFDGASGALLRVFTQPAPESRALFGYSVANVGTDALIVGAPLDDRFARDGGAVYLFRATGELEAILGDETPAVFDFFGGAVDSDGRSVAVAAAHEVIDGIPAAGSVQIFDTAGRFRRTIRNPTPGPLDHFGFPLSFVPGRKGGILMGAPFDSTGAAAAGAVYLFTRSGRRLRTFMKPTPPGPAAQDYFSPLAAVGRDLVLVGAFGDDAGGTTDAGAAYLLRRNGRVMRVFENPSPAEGDWFGWSSLSIGNDVAVGAPLDDTVAIDAGAAYLWPAPARGWRPAPRERSPAGARATR